MLNLWHPHIRPALRLLIALIVMLNAPAALAQFPINQTFSTNTASNWVLGNDAVLTGTSGASTDGWLRLTTNAGSAKGYAYYNSAFPAPRGVDLDFEYKTWGGTGADGFTVFLFDGATTTGNFKIGDFGGALGYCAGYSNALVGGLSNAYVGIAFDEYGNFANNGDRCTNGGPSGRQIDSVAIRGPGNGNTGYAYLTHANAPGGIDYATSTSTRPDDASFYRRVNISIVPTTSGTTSTYKIFVRWQTSVGGAYTTLINGYTLPSAPPSTLKLGFAASTGGSTNYHEIRRLIVTEPADLQISKTGPSNLSPGNPITYTVQATNQGSNDAVLDDRPTLLDNVPGLIENVTWTCLASGTAGTSCGSASGAGNTINTLPSLPVGGTVTYTINGVVSIDAAAQTLTNTTSIALPAGSNLSDPNPGNNTAFVNTIISGFGLSGFVFEDRNANGVFEPNEPGIPNITVNLTGAATGSTTTGPTGGYGFSNLPTGNYTVTEPSDPAGYVSTTPNTLTARIVNRSINGQDYGEFLGARITGTVFRDDGFSSLTGPTYSVPANVNNGLQNAPEPGIPNVTLTATGTGSVSARTDANGNYTLYVPLAMGATINVSHALPAATGTNINGGSITLSTNAIPANSITVTGVTGGLTFDARNFGVVQPSLLQPDQSGSTTSPGSVTYTHLYRPGTLGTVVLSATSSAGYNRLYHLDSNCDGTVTPSERSAPITSFTVSGTWPRDTGGRFKACALEVVVLAPTGRPALETDVTTVNTNLAWTNSTVMDTSRINDTTRLNGAAGELQLDKQVRNFTTGGSFAASAGGKPNEVLEYCITYRNAGVTSVTNVIMRDPVPFFTTFVTSSIQLRQLDDTVISNISDAAGFNATTNTVVVNIGTVNPGESRKMCYRARIK